MLNFSRIAGTILFLVLGTVASLAQQRSVALTFDDLPAADSTDPDEIRSLNISLLNSLDQHHAPAVGFVIEGRVQAMGKVQGAKFLGEWRNRGYGLGNHTFSHTSFNNLTAEQFEQDIIAGEATIEKTRYFRFPENNSGDTKDKHDAIAAFLKARGYRVAVCTIDTEDYLFNAAYLKMLSRNDEASAARLRADYLAYTATQIDYYSELHKKVFGREIPHVMLLHVNRLNADLIDEVLELFERKEYRFVSLDTALSDPAYDTPDTQVIKYGWMWGYRWAKELGITVDMRLEADATEWVLQYGRNQW